MGTLGPRTALALGLLAAGVGFVAGWSLREDPASLEWPEPGAEAPLGTDEAPGLVGLPGAKARFLEQELRGEQARRAQLEEEALLLRHRVHVLEGGDPSDPRFPLPAGGGDLAAGARTLVPRRPVETGAVMVFPGVEAVAGAVDWSEAGAALVELKDLVEDYRQSVLDGKPLPESVAEFHRLSGYLRTAAARFQKLGLTGTSINGVLTHPAVQVNLIVAALAQAARPLSEAQHAELDRVGREFVEAERRRVAGYGDGVFALEAVLDEALLKDRFYDEVDRLLTAAQRDALHPDGIKGRLGLDLFSSGLVWRQNTDVLVQPERDRIELAYAKAIADRWRIGAADRDHVLRLAADWAASFSTTFLEDPEDARTLQQKWLPVERVRFAAAQQLQVLKRLAASLPEGHALVQKARQETVVLVPYLRAAASR